MFCHRQRLATASLACVLACLGARAAGGDLEAARKHKAVAVEHLRKADEPGANRVKELKAAEAGLIDAQKILAAFEEPVPPEVETELSEINSLIYWTRKMMPLDSGKSPRPTPTPRPQPRTSSSLGKRQFEAAERYARENPDKPFLIAVRFYEVATRYAGTSWSIKAQRLALDYQKKALAAAQAERAAKKASPSRTTVKPPAGRRDSEPRVSRTTSEPTVAKPVLLEYDKLTKVLASDTSRSKMAEACKTYLEQSPEGKGSSEVRSISEALAAETGDAGTLTWFDYLVSYPQGLATRRALDALRRSEGTAFTEIAKSLQVDDIDRALRISRACLRALPGRSWGGEVKSLLGILKLQPGATRTSLVRQHLRRYSRGKLAGTLREVVEQWVVSDEVDAYDSLFQSFASKRSRPERGLAVGGFLKSYPGGVHSVEVKALRLAVMPDDPRKRLEGARAYLQDYPQGVFSAEVRGLVQDFVEEVNAGLFAETMKTSGDRGLAYKERLAAAERYLEEFPDGDRARQARAAAESVRALIEDEARAYEELTATLEDVDTEGALKACVGFLAKHGHGAHRSEVQARREEYGLRLSGEMEARAYDAVAVKLRRPALSRIAKAEALLGFLKSFANGAHRKKARAQLRELAPGRLGSLAGPVRTAVFSSDSKTLVTADADASRAGTGLWVWNAREGRLVARYQASSGFSASSAAFGPGDRELWVGETSGGLIAWDISSGRVLGRYRVGGGAVTSTAPVGDGLAVTASLGDTKLRLWTSGDWSLSDSVTCPGAVASGAASPNGEVIAVGLGDGGIVCYQAQTSAVLWTVSDAHARAVGHLCFSPDGRHIASCSPDAGTVAVHDARTGKKIWDAKDATPTVAFAGAGGVLTGAGLRSLESGLLRVKLGGGGPVAASPDGKFALTTDGKGGGTLWYLPALLQ